MPSIRLLLQLYWLCTSCFLLVYFWYVNIRRWSSVHQSQRTHDILVVVVSDVWTVLYGHCFMPIPHGQKVVRILRYRLCSSSVVECVGVVTVTNVLFKCRRRRQSVCEDQLNRITYCTTLCSLLRGLNIITSIRAYVVVSAVETHCVVVAKDSPFFLFSYSTLPSKFALASPAWKQSQST